MENAALADRKEKTGVDIMSRVSNREKARKEALEEVILVKKRMPKIKHKLAILSGKGGVGKSTFTANLAIALANKKYKVGILDADIHGPSVPKILNVRGQKLKMSRKKGKVSFRRRVRSA